MNSPARANWTVSETTTRHKPLFTKPFENTCNAASLRIALPASAVISASHLAKPAIR